MLVSKAMAGDEIDDVPLGDSCEYQVVKMADSTSFLQEQSGREQCVSCDASSGCDLGSFPKFIEPLLEGATEDIDCGKENVVKEIVEASFGWPTGPASKFTKHPDMHDPGSKGMIETDCKGMQSCTVHSAASAGWNPKPGRGRWLTAKIRCAKAKAPPNPVCCPQGMYIQPGAATPKDTICVGADSAVDTPCALFETSMVRPCLLPTLKTCFKTCANIDKGV
jgi:hypothetical protein